ncbi:hypothetical protein M1432_00435 [Patescibacteria group bacterium]|nr:hypothetical protein [Patescibacteria group bacterium]
MQVNKKEAVLLHNYGDFINAYWIILVPAVSAAIFAYGVWLDKRAGRRRRNEDLA